jgi:superfamily II DNA or RNA helicase/phage anti-repressor protein
MQTNKKILGTVYEYYVLENIKKDFEKVWHWSDFPEKLMYENKMIKNYDNFCKYRYDVGADLVAFKDNKYFFIQCKNFSETILMESLAGFYFLLYEYNLTGILYYNGTLSQRVIDLSMDKIKFVNMPFNNQTINMIKEPQIMEVREYQKEAVIKLKNKKSSILSIPCGMGKTYIASLLAKDYDNIIILSPLRCLAQQTLEQFKNYMGYDYEPILVSIDGTRDMKKINSYIKNKNIFSSTYCSVDIIYKIITNLKNVFIIIDEFHNLSDNEINNKEKIMNKILYYDCNKIFLSATPIDNFMEIKEIYTYSWENAIKNKYICDFDIYIPDKNDDFSSLTNLCNENMNIKTITKTYFMLKSMLFNGDKKMICFTTCIDYALETIRVLEWMSKMLCVSIDFWTINCNTSKTNRSEIITKFIETKNMAIIVNVQILNEGIDIPECDSIFIMQPNNNIHNIVQRMSRANRIMNNKNKCNIYLWCSKNKTQTIMNYLCKNMESSIKKKIYVYNTKNSLINNYVFSDDIKINDNNVNNQLIIIPDEAIDYLKTNSNIDKKFIDDFYSCIGKNYFELSDKFLIDSNKLQMWLNITSRKDFHETIKRSYVVDIDYIIVKKKKKGIGKSNEKIYMLTPDCAKMLLQATKSKRGAEVRKYFIEIEKMLYKFKDLIIKKLNDELKKLQHNQKPKTNNKKKKLYVFKALNTDLTLYKLGRAKDLKTRFKSHNSPMANDIEVIYEYETENLELVEDCIKAQMKHAQYRKYKEVYQIDLNIIKKFIKQCDKNIELVKKYIDNNNTGNYFMFIPEQ